MRKSKSIRLQKTDLQSAVDGAVSLAANRVLELGGNDVEDVNGGIVTDPTIGVAGYFPTGGLDFSID